MSGPISRRKVDAGLLDMLKSTCGDKVPVGLAEVPDDPVRPGSKVDVNALDARYAIIYPVLTQGDTSGPPFGPEQDGDCEYDIRVAVGRDRGMSECQWAADLIFAALFNREDHGEPVNEISMTGHVELDRSAPSGPPASTLLSDVWQSTVNVRLTVTSGSS